MERLLHYTWKHKLFPLHTLRTTDGCEVEVISPGQHNSDAGPDFSNAKVRIGDTLWVGNVEIHQRTSDWFRHHHDTDPSYANIILHVAGVVDMPLHYPDGKEIPQLQLDVPDDVRDNYQRLAHNDNRPPCLAVVSALPALTVHNWMTSLMLERFEERARQIMERRDTLDKDWEDTFFVTLARNFGFGINGDAFERWAHSIPMRAVAKHRDDLFQIEAIFFGQAGLLEDEPEDEVNPMLGETLRATSGGSDDYYRRLRSEYRYLRQKFSLTPVDPKAWKFLRLRPQNFPHVRIAQLAAIYHERRLDLSRLVNAATADETRALLITRVSDYWREHYTFSGERSKPADRTLSKSSLDLVLINSAAPILFAYGRYKSDQALCDRAFNLWQQLPAEANRVTRDWASAGVACENAADSQALIQLHHAYCQRRDCLRCKFGNEYISRTPSFLREREAQLHSCQNPSPE